MRKIRGIATALSIVILLSTVSAQQRPAAPPQPVPQPAPSQPAATQPAATQPPPSQPVATQQSPAPQAPSQAAAPKPAPVTPDYRLANGDKLRVEVYRDAQLSQSLQIRPDGKITLPLLGDIAATGKTPTELRDSITAALREYITNPVVTVIVVESTPGTVFVMGEVNRPGTHMITGPVSILQVLAMAGGFKDFAHTKDIRVLRKSSTGVRTLNFNYNEAIKSNAQSLILEPGDTVIVP